MALFAASLAVLWRRPVTKPSSQAWWSLVGASAIMGAAHWVRPEGVLYLGGFVIASAAILATNSQRALLQIGLCTMVFGLVVLPLLWPGQGPSTDPVPLSKFRLQLDRASVESEDEFLASLEKVEVHTGAAWHLKRWGSNIFKVYHRVLPQDMDLLLAGFALMGLVLVGEGREVFSRAALVGIAVVVVPLAFILPASEGCWPRYFVSLLPVVIVFAGIGIARCREVLAPSSWKLVLALVAVLLVMYLEPLADMYKAPFVGEVPFEEKEAGAWLRDHAAPGALVMTRKTTVGWYSGLPTVRTPIGSFEQVLHWARENGVSYWVETERHTPDLRPELAFLLDRQQAPGDLELVKTIEKPMRLLIYKMRARGPAAPVRAQTER